MLENGVKTLITSHVTPLKARLTLHLIFSPTGCLNHLGQYLFRIWRIQNSGFIFNEVLWPSVFSQDFAHKLKLYRPKVYFTKRKIKGNQTLFCTSWNFSSRNVKEIPISIRY